MLGRGKRKNAFVGTRKRFIHLGGLNQSMSTIIGPAPKGGKVRKWGKKKPFSSQKTIGRKKRGVRFKKDSQQKGKIPFFWGGGRGVPQKKFPKNASNYYQRMGKKDGAYSGGEKNVTFRESL